MIIRPTDQSRVDTAILSIQQRSTDLSVFQNQISSGLRVQHPSDDPAAFVAISQAKTASSRLSAYSQTISNSTSTLNSSVSTLQDVNDLLVQARQIAQQGADSGTNGDPTANEALAVQVDGLINRALRDGNAQPDGKSLYGGTATGSLPFSVSATDALGRPTAITYTGAPDRARAITGPNQTVDTRYVGSAVFQKPGADVFQSLIALRDNLRNTTLVGPARATAIGQDLTNLDAARSAIGDTVGEQSSDLATLESVQSLTSDVKLNADTRVGDLASTDYASAVVKMQEQTTALSAIYATTAKLLQPGLLNFIQG